MDEPRIVGKPSDNVCCPVGGMIVDYDHIEQKIGLLIESAENRVTYCVYTVFNRNYNGGLYREILSEIGCCSSHAPMRLR